MPRLRPRLQRVHGHPGDHLQDLEARFRDLEHREVGVDAVDAGRRRQRIAALLHETRLPVLRLMLHQHPDALGAGGKVHGPADGRREVVGGCRPVGEIAVFGDLEGAEDAKIDVPAANQREAVGVVDEASAWPERHVLLPSVDHPRIHVPVPRRRTHGDDAVLRMENDLAVLRDVIADQRRRADAEVDEPAFRNVAGEARGHLVPGEWQKRAQGILLKTRWDRRRAHVRRGARRRPA
jgi:hypothetical protein